jgi:hypothetical protein
MMPGKIFVYGLPTQTGPLAGWMAFLHIAGQPLREQRQERNRTNENIPESHLLLWSASVHSAHFFSFSALTW